jgi:beta-mannosidase
MHNRIFLNGSHWFVKDFYGEDWRLRGSHLPGSRDKRHWRTGSVPGCPHHDLWKLGEIPDPYVDRNSLLIEWIPQRTWVYKKAFTVGDEVKGRRVQLHFEGVDYRAEFFLNGESLGTHTGMFTKAVFDVTENLLYGAENLLAVVIEAAPLEETQVGRTSRVSTLKTRMNYWWDFCPRMLHVGIWDDVYLEITGPVRIEDVFVRPLLSENLDRANVSVLLELDSSIRGRVDVEIALHQAGSLRYDYWTHLDLEIGPVSRQTCFELDSPRLWWPNGHGDQQLYEAEVCVFVHSDETGQYFDLSDTRSVPFGIRQVELIQNETAGPDALPYTFLLNGRRIYAKGWNWVPMDVMYSVPHPEKLKHLLGLAKSAHVNLLRVWGGGLIEKESFYSECDRLGILVWQEFIQSSSGIDNTPSASDEFIQMLTGAAEQIVPRKRNHPSLAIWCGGNELSSEGVPLDDSHPVLEALKRTVQRLDPDRLWLPTSPSGPVFGNSLEEIERQPSGLHDVHGPWEYQGAAKQCELYNRGTSLLHSEFGVEGLTNLRTLNKTVGREHQWPVDLDNPHWFHRGAWWVKRPVWDETFGELPNIETLVHATQFMQADGLRYALEADRRRKYHNSGTLPWQFNEPYPMAACTSAVDYYGRPKPSYYAVARAYAPLSVSAKFSTLAWNGCEDFDAEIWVANSKEGTHRNASLQMRLMGLDGSLYAGQMETVCVDASCAARLAHVHESIDRIKDKVFFLDLQLCSDQGVVLCQNRYVFSRTADLAPFLACPPAQLSASSSGTENEQTLALTNAGSTAAMFLWLEEARDLHAPGYAYFGDNYFCLLPGESRKVSVVWKDVPAEEQRVEISAWNAALIVLDRSLQKEA